MQTLHDDDDISNGKAKYFSIIVLFYFSFVRLLRLVDGRMRAH